ncbi:MAG: DoxX family protein [Candidatus Nomurabacteria bacterium]|nr:DoxX family protein [Candidatus Nomurabacteria bacterium]
MKINYALTSRILIALVFVVAGVQKLMDFAGTTDYMGSLGLPLPVIAALIAIIVEIPIALAYAWGYKVCTTGWILAIFALLTILIAHRDWSNAMNMTMALKNIAIIGGLIATIGACKCVRHK